ncbi:MAG: xylulokinase [Thermomicrobiales bacterium]|nr:MAG: xylulokinase [Thermomicrobiales bacterium]
MSTPALLAVDLGTGSVKALVIDEQCVVLGSAASPYPVHRPHEGWAEQQPTEWWRATVSAIRDACAQAAGSEIAAVGLSGQMHGTVLLDRNGEPVRPAVIWEDRRSAEQVRYLTETIGGERLIELCGSPVATGFQAATLAWLAKHEPDTLARTWSILLPADYLRYRLTGLLATEPSDASSTVLFDIQRRAWAPELASAVGIDLAQLPGVHPSTEMSGKLTIEAATALGLRTGLPVAGGGADAPLAALAAAATTSDTLLLTISTGSQAILPAGQPVVDLNGRVHTWCSLAERGSDLPAWYQMGATLASGRALRWLRGEIMSAGMGQIDESVTTTPPGSEGLLFLPYLNGERTPHMDPDASGAFIGLTANHGKAELTRSVMEGSVFALLDAFQVLQELGGAPERIVLAGGGARSHVWTQIVADIFGLPVDPLEESEGSAMGAAIVAGAASGWFELAEGARRSARFGLRVDPNPVAAGIYQELHPIFQRAYQVLRDDLHTLGDIASRARAVSISA